MRLLNLILILVLATSVGCSKMKKKAKGDTAAEDAAKLDGEDADFIVDNNEMDNDLIAAEDNIMEKVGNMKEKALDQVEDVKDVMTGNNIANISAPATSMSGEVGSYSVQRGETLMMIAFKLYGDYSKWRDIQNMNSGISAQGLRTGMNLKYQMPSSRFTFNPAGEPYLVRIGDTLGTISNDKYGKITKWRSIWDNNRPMIKDPNLIFAGFTIYYIPDRNIASE